MSVEIPSALIRRIQAKLRKNAGVPSSYDPTDPSLISSLPTLDDALSDLDAADDPSHPRCGKCRRGAGLLRGPKSTVCVFCGHDRRRDGVVQSISFNSTAACKKLLEFLHLDGSEVVNLNTESNDSNKGHDTQRDGLVLSTVLDLELKWPPEKEDEDAVDRRFDKTQTNAQDVNFSAVDLDSFFSDSKSMEVSGGPSVTSEELMPGKQTITTEPHISSGPDNFCSFNDFQTSSMAVKSKNSKDGGDFSDSFASWDAGFQSASSQAFHSESESVDHYLGSSTARPASSATNVAIAAEFRSVDLFESSPTVISTHVTPASTSDELSNFKHESGNKVSSVEPTNEWGDFSGSSDWIQDDFWPSTSNQLKNKSNTNDNELKDDVQCMTSADVSWGEDEMWAPSNTKASEIKSEHYDHDVNDLDDALDSWQDFASSKEAPGVSSNSWIHSGTAIDDNASTLKFVGLQDIDFGDFFQPESLSGALAEDGCPNKVNDNQLNTSASTNNIDECLNVKNMHEIHDDDDDAFDDALDSWQDFASSKETAEVSSVSWIQCGNEITSNEHASARRSVDAPTMEPDNFPQLESFLGAKGEQGGPKKLNDNLLDTSGSTSNIEEILNVKNSNGNSSEAWQDISSSNGASGDLSNLWTPTTTWSKLNEVSGTQSLEIHDMEFGSFLFSGSLSAAVGGQQDPSEVNARNLDPPVSSSITNEVDISNQNYDNDDSLDDWQDFTSSNKSAGVLPDTLGAEGTSRDYFPGAEAVDAQDTVFDGFLHSGSLSAAAGGQQDPSEASARNLDPPVSSTSTNEFDVTKHNDDNDDSLDDWQDFTSSMESAGVLPDTSGAGFLHSGPLSGAVDGQREPSEASARKLDPPVSSTCTNEFDVTKHNDDNDDSLDDWQDFTSSMESAGVMPDTSGAENTSGDHFPGMKSVDPQYSAFDGFLHSGSLSGAVGGQQDPSEANHRKLDFPVSSTCRNESGITKRNDDSDGSLDYWQDFTSSKESAGVLPNTSGAQGTSRDHISLVIPVGPHESEFDGFLYSGSLSGALGGQKDPREANARKLDPAFSNNSINEFDTMKRNDNNADSLAYWHDFTSLTEAHGVLPIAYGPGANATLRDHALGANSVGPQNSEFGSFAFLDSFGKKGSSYVNDIRLDASVSNSSKSSNNMNQNNGFFGSWKEFSGLDEVPRKLSNLSTQTITKDASYKHTLEMKSGDFGDIEFGDFLQSDVFPGASHQEDSSNAKDDQLGTFVSPSSINAHSNTKNGDDNNEPVDAWQDFISSHISQRRSSTKLEEPNMRVTSSKHISGTKSLDLQDIEFGDFLHSGFFSGASGGKRCSTEMNNMQDASVSYRMNGNDDKFGMDSVIRGSAHVPGKSIHASKLESTNSKVARMPDLLFMLEDNLCISKKVDSTNLQY